MIKVSLIKIICHRIPVNVDTNLAINYSGMFNSTNCKTADERNALRKEHVSKAEIEARLVIAGLGGFPLEWGYDVVARALDSSNAELDFDIPAAAEWLVICGQRS
jgi:hypothetical protein